MSEQDDWLAQIDAKILELEEAIDNGDTSRATMLRFQGLKAFKAENIWLWDV